MILEIVHYPHFQNSNYVDLIFRYFVYSALLLNHNFCTHLHFYEQHTYGRSERYL